MATLRELAAALGAVVVTGEANAEAAIDMLYAGDTISAMLEGVTDRTLLVSEAFSSQLLRVAALMDVPGICLAGGEGPSAEQVGAAARQGTCLMLSPYNLVETCGRLAKCLPEAQAVAG